MAPTTKYLSSGSPAYKLRTAWVAGYLRDPAMFHGVLYAASAHLDLINGDNDNPVTNFHRAESIRLVNATLSHLESQDDLPVTVLATTWVLSHIAVRFPTSPFFLLGSSSFKTNMQRLTGRVSEAHIHESGLAQMVRNRDQSSGLGFDGALSFLIML